MQIRGEIDLEDLVRVGRFRERVELSGEAIKRMEASREIVEKTLKEGRAVYGVNTGFGALVNVRISGEELEELQRNIVLSHSAGFGKPMPEEVVRGAIFLRAVSLSKGFSGVRPIVVEKLLELINEDICPYVPEKGSVGASGDLAPLAHVAAVLMGEGMILSDGKPIRARDFLESKGFEPIVLKEKEGLALVNGTQFMTSIAGFVVRDSMRLLKLATLIAAMSIDALLGSTDPFRRELHEIRPHPGQMEIARVLYESIEGSSIRESHRNCMRIQDAYTLRTVPQVYGAVLDTLSYAKSVIEREMNSVTDNPVVLPSGEIISGGNFHGEPIALVSDFVSIALTDLGNMIERRIDKLLNPKVNEGLPPFLARGKEGLNSGYMLFQYTAAAICNENKILSHPASSDTIPTSAYQEDHVSMGMNAARKSMRVLENLIDLVSIEALLASVALELRKPLETSRTLRKLKDEILSVVHHTDGDDFFWEDFMRVREIVEEKVKGDSGIDGFDLQG